jgi:predicted DsbA family dithiol-disulfide isomerase
MGPPLPPTTTGAIFGNAAAPIRVELFLDLICPFSRKMWGAVIESGVPQAMNQVCFIVNQVPQPWHPQGTYVHEAALAVKEVAPHLYGPYVTALYAAFDAGKFKDDDTWNKSRQMIYEELLDIAATVGVDRASVQAMLTIGSDGGNAGSGMTQAIKWCVKYHRTRGVHVTPTVHVNGLEAGVVSSGWSSAQWHKFLEAQGSDCFRAEGV